VVVAPACSQEEGGGTKMILSAEEHYLNKDQSLRTLVVLCRGLKDSEGNQLMDIKGYPWNKLKISTVKPSVSEYVGEVERRWEETTLLPSASLLPPWSSRKTPQPKGWNSTI
jgi:hypothetical protein